MDQGAVWELKSTLGIDVLVEAFSKQAELTEDMRIDRDARRSIEGFTPQRTGCHETRPSRFPRETR